MEVVLVEVKYGGWFGCAERGSVSVFLEEIVFMGYFDKRFWGV